jgi:hypothetical protein
VKTHLVAARSKGRTYHPGDGELHGFLGTGVFYERYRGTRSVDSRLFRLMRR